MTRGSTSLLSILIFSAVVPSIFLYSDAFLTVVVTKVNRSDTNMRRGRWARKPLQQRSTVARHFAILIPDRATAMVKSEDMLGGGDFDGGRRAQLADAIAQEFNVRVRDVRRACDLRLEQERATHRVELAEQRVELLKGMVPQAAHEAIVTSYEEASAAALKQVAASSAAALSAIAEESSKREDALRVRVAERDASLERAASDLRDMSKSLAGLKQSVDSLKAALRSQVSLAEDARETMAREIRANEVEPQRRRANAAETDLSELRQATHRWLALAHMLKLEAAADARASSYAEGRAHGREEASLKSEAQRFLLREELVKTKQVLFEQSSRSRLERQALREEVVKARHEAVELLREAGAAGMIALNKSREVWMAKGRAEGFDAGLAEGKAVGRMEGIAVGRADSTEESRTRLRAAEEMRAEADAASEAEAKLRETLDLYMERIFEVETRRGTFLSDVATAASIDDAKPVLAWRGISPKLAGVSAKQENAAYPASSSFFWQDCGGQGF